MTVTFDPNAVVTCDAELEAAVGSRPGPSMLKSIRFLDPHCENILALTPFVVVGTTTATGDVQAFALGGDPGFAAPRASTELDLGAGLDDGSGRDVVDGAPAGLIAMVPGYNETLRINGRLRIDGSALSLDVEEAFLHCAKAILRSELWTTSDSPSGATTADVAEVTTATDFLAASPFVLVATLDADGHADVSPKGDPAGLIRRLDDATVAIADRPGNRRTDTLHNLMDDRRIALLALRPGHDQVTEVRGTAQVCTDPGLLEAMRLRDKTPNAALVIEVHHTDLRAEPAIAAADLWNPARHVVEGTLPRGARIWTDHVKRNTDPGAGAAMTRKLVNEKALAVGIAHDYQTNL